MINGSVPQEDIEILIVEPPNNNFKIYEAKPI
jgi:hypothetical protein